MNSDEERKVAEKVLASELEILTSTGYLTMTPTQIKREVEGMKATAKRLMKNKKTATKFLMSLDVPKHSKVGHEECPCGGDCILNESAKIVQAFGGWKLTVTSPAYECQQCGFQLLTEGQPATLFRRTRSEYYKQILKHCKTFANLALTRTISKKEYKAFLDSLQSLNTL